MALPTFVQVGTAAGGTGIVTPGLPSGWAADDLHILVTNTKRAEALVNVSGWTRLGAATPTTDNKVTVFYRDAVGGDAAPSVPDSGDHTYAIIIGFRNPNGGTCEIDATFATDVVNTASTAVSWPSLTTVGADRMILHALADGRDATLGRFSGETNANLANLAERWDNGITSNDGGGLVLVTGEKATAGAIGNTTGTLTSATQALITLAIEAPGGGTDITGTMDADETGSDAFAGEGEVAVTGALDAQDAGSDTAAVSGQVLVAGALDADETGADTFEASGAVTDPAIAGTMDATETGADVLEATGTVAITGFLAGQEDGADSFAGTGSVESTASGQVTSSGSSTWSRKTASRIAREAERARKAKRNPDAMVARQVATIFGGTADARQAAQAAVAEAAPDLSGLITTETLARIIAEAQRILELQDDEDTLLLLAAA